MISHCEVLGFYRFEHPSHRYQIAYNDINTVRNPILPEKITQDFKVSEY